MEKNISNYYLVLEYRPGDFMPIDINVFLDDKYKTYYSSFMSIDSFTKNYSEYELREMIRLNNLVPNMYLSGRLIIMDDNRHRFPLYTKDVDYSLPRFLLDNIDNKIIMNKFMNVYIKNVKHNKEYIDKMKLAINSKNVNEILTILGSLSYKNIRDIFMYINDNIISIEKRRVLENEMAA